MKKVLVVSYLYYPSTEVGARRIYNLRKFLKDEEIDVTILTVDFTRYAELDESLDYHGEKVFRTPSFGPVKVTKRVMNESFAVGFTRRAAYLLKRLCSQILFPDEYIGWRPFAVAKGIRLHKEEKFDYVLATGRPWSDFIIGRAIARKCKIPIILDYRDPWTADENIFFPSAFIKKISHWYEQRLVRYVDKIIVNTEAVKELFLKHFRHNLEGKIFVVTNGYDPQTAEHLEKASVDRGDHTGQGMCRLIHTGSFFESRSLETLIQAMRQLHEEKVIHPDNFEILSYGPLLGKDKRLLQQFNLTAFVKEHSFIPYFDSLKMLCKSSMNLLIVGNGHGSMIPAKLFDYLLARRPIFCVGPEISEAGKIIKAHDYGFYARINDPKDIAVRLRDAIHLYRQGKMQEPLTVPDQYSIRNQVHRLAVLLKGGL
ncbi:MAG: glycosyltransferase [Candidatus Omnitrophica bacterium]|nr:glycosyltransferase [Candidatus Omnitrophota bacterium]